MSDSDERLSGVVFTATDLVKLISATYLPLCDELEAAGVLNRQRLADLMGYYVEPGEVSASAALIAALQNVLRRPRGGQADAPVNESLAPSAGETALRVIVGGRDLNGRDKA